MGVCVLESSSFERKKLAKRKEGRDETKFAPTSILALFHAPFIYLSILINNSVDGERGRERRFGFRSM